MPIIWRHPSIKRRRIRRIWRTRTQRHADSTRFYRDMGDRRPLSNVACARPTPTVNNEREAAHPSDDRTLLYTRRASLRWLTLRTRTGRPQMARPDHATRRAMPNQRMGSAGIFKYEAQIAVDDTTSTMEGCRLRRPQRETCGHRDDVPPIIEETRPARWRDAVPGVRSAPLIHSFTGDMNTIQRPAPHLSLNSNSAPYNSLDHDQHTRSS